MSGSTAMEAGGNRWGIRSGPPPALSCMPASQGTETPAGGFSKRRRRMCEMSRLLPERVGRRPRRDRVAERKHLDQPMWRFCARTAEQNRTRARMGLAFWGICPKMASNWM